jgi:predicted RNase H-like HicB family nuclease
MKYTVQDIEDMRVCVRTLSIRRDLTREEESVVEDRLRTYMANGTTLEELMESSDEAMNIVYEKLEVRNMLKSVSPIPDVIFTGEYPK